MTSGGPGSGLYVSATAATPGSSSAPSGDAEGRSCNGLPEGIWGKVGVAVAPSRLAGASTP